MGGGREWVGWKVGSPQRMAGTTMHLIINSVDTRGWMSDGLSLENGGGGGEGWQGLGRGTMGELERG
uniref:Uncharacterized protein n=1 Tax=Vespula pensylvanica TaxID=30213 RepID=A0A834UDF5_VESPE|nr:hypothetical protein H0235_004955 [Vespula pensylvanica]